MKSHSAMKRFLVVMPLLCLLLALGFGCGKSRQSISTNASNEPPPDILSATNLAQWMSLIKDLRPTAGLREDWSTSRFRRGTPSVLVWHDGQSILLKAEAVHVTAFPKTMDFMEAQIFTPGMTVDETRALGMNLCGMFGFDTNKFSTWCDTDRTDPDAPVFYTGNHRYVINVRPTFNEEKPWFIIFMVQDENAAAKLNERFLRGFK